MDTKEEQKPNQNNSFEQVVNLNGELVARKMKTVNPQKDTESIVRIVSVLLKLSLAGLVLMIILAMNAGEGALGAVPFILLFGAIFLIFTIVASFTAFSATKKYKKLGVTEPKAVKSLTNLSRICGAILLLYLILQLRGSFEEKKRISDHENLVAQFKITEEHSVHRVGFSGMSCFVEFADGPFIDLVVAQNSSEYEKNKPVCDSITEQIANQIVTVKNYNEHSHTGDVYFQGKLLNSMFSSQ